MNIYEHFFHKENDWKDLDFFLRKRMSELVELRNHLILDSYISEYESKYVIPNMQTSNPEGVYDYPSADYVYGCQLREAMTYIFAFVCLATRSSWYLATRFNCSE